MNGADLMKTYKNLVPNKKAIDLIKYFSFLNLGILMMAAGIYFFKSTNGFATGGVSGISIILAKIFPKVTQATYMIIINVILLIVGVIILGKKCGALTFYCSLMMSLENWLFEYFIALSGPITEHTLLELIYAVGLTGIGAAIIFRCNASSGGTDIVALILKKYTSLDVGKALLATDFLIASCTFLLFGVKAGLFSMLGLFTKAFLVDLIIDSVNSYKYFVVITEHKEEISQFIMTQLHHGATVTDAVGTYTNNKKAMIHTVCKRLEAIRLRKEIKEIDPHAFIVITTTSEIIGRGFRSV